MFREQRTFGDSRWPFTLARPEAVDYAPERLPRHATRSSTRCWCCRWNERYEAQHVATTRARDPRRGRARSRRADDRAQDSASIGAGASPVLRRRSFADIHGRRDRRPSPTSGREAAEALAEALAASPARRTAHARGPDVDAVARVHAALDPPRDRAPPHRAGRHVLCEKPLAIDSASARRMVAAAERPASLFTMASKFRYVNDVIQARQHRAAGDLARSSCSRTSSRRAST